MATRSLDFFCMPEEFAEIIGEAALAAELYYFVWYWPPSSQSIPSPTELKSALTIPNTFSVYVWDSPFDPTRLERYQFEGVELGIVGVHAPRLEGRVLSCASIGTTHFRTTPEEQRVFDSSNRIFDLLKKEIMRNTKGSVWELESGKRRPSKRYTAKARNWESEGNLLGALGGIPFYFTTIEPDNGNK